MSEFSSCLLLDDRSNNECMSPSSTKERILDAAEELMLKRSFHSVGLSQILSAVQVPKGSFYHYFASKEEFGVEMLKHYMADTNAMKRGLLFCREDEPDPLKRLFGYLETFEANIRKDKGQFPCLVLKLASEVTDLSEAMREELHAGFEEWIGYYTTILEEAVEANLLPADTDIPALAQLIQDLWTGAVERSVINHDPAPAHQARLFIESHLRSLHP